MKRPELMWLDGRIVPWAEAQVHVWTELATRGANVFEGIRAYAHEDGALHLVALDEHIARLYQSAHLLRLPVSCDAAAMREAIFELVDRFRGQGDLYVRPTLYLAEGRYETAEEGAVTGAYVVVVPAARSTRTTEGIGALVSSHRKAPDLTLSPLIKTGAAYQLYRLPMLEARDAGLDEAILLNTRDEVAEATGAAVFAVKRGALVTPPLSAGILDSITRRLVMRLAERHLGLPVIERALSRSELWAADEIFLAGTLCEIKPVVRLGTMAVGSGEPGPHTRALQQRYIDICTGRAPDEDGWLTPVPQRRARA